MPFYGDINHDQRPEEEIQRIADGLLGLKAGLRENIPAKRFDKLLLATWNIREFDSPAYGKRSDEAIYYIAEIIDHFDLVAVQEVRDDLDGLRRVMRLLGNNYKVLFTDVTEGRPGNKERTAFIYDTRKVEMGGLAGELVVPPTMMDELPNGQFARTPYVVGFKTRWYKFMVVTAHLIYGEGKASAEDRVKEAKVLSQLLAHRADNANAWSDTIVLLGDFNIFNPESETFKAIAEHFRIPEEVAALKTNVPQSKHFDQIAFRTPYLGHLFSVKYPVKTGIFNFYDYVYRPSDESLYQEEIGERYHTNSKGEARTESEKTNYYKTYWRTHQMSDHFPLWIELPIDRSQQFLEEFSSSIGKSFGIHKINNQQSRDEF